MSIDFTVAIPTYNGADRLPQILERLRSQTHIDQLSWEIIIVDNNSTDNTAQVVENHQADWPPEIPLRYCLEPKQGAGFARQHAIQVAQGELVGFLDDDNWPAPNWIGAALSFAQTHPQAGAYGSKIHGNFEVNPPPELKKMLFYLAIVDRGPAPLQYNPRQKGTPPSAGLVVRRQAWSDNVPKQQFFTGRTGSILVASEDEEALLYIHRAGWEIWYNPEMEIEHCISANRFEKRYFITLMRSIGLSRHHFRMFCLHPWQRPPAFLLYFANDLRKLLLHLIRYRQVMDNDIAATCERERLYGTLISPFYTWKMRLDRLLKPSRSEQGN